ncbi:hypothetical protein JZM32_01630 [Acinetobacter pittii]|uniref:hypothetical protein n=1 Tax=Acinetobacter pittii TaxID=48296 RepID=UPI00197CEC9C|nr:hypothetical protein [Acinetobacter pittii]MBN6526692.1 hypothetical protein [Acinetobacter pittii]
MDKFKFYLVKFSYDIEEVCSLLSSNNDDFYGIKFIKKENHIYKFNFYERKILETTYLDKDFNEHTIEQLKTDDFIFYIFEKKNSFFLLLENPNRNINFFKNFISQKLNNKIIINSLELNPFKLYEYLNRSIDSKFIASTIEVKDIQLNSSTIATLTLKSTNDLQNHFEQYIQAEKYYISKIILTNSEKFKGKLLFCHDCSLGLQIHNQGDFMNVFINFLVENQ